MAQQIILTGTVANDKTGDTIKAAFTKVNGNFTELYASINVSDISQLTDSTHLIPTDIKQLADSESRIPTDVNQLSDTGGLLAGSITDINQLTDTDNRIATDISQLADSTNRIPVDINQLSNESNLFQQADLGKFVFAANELSLSTYDDLTVQAQGTGLLVLQSANGINLKNYDEGNFDYTWTLGTDGSTTLPTNGNLAVSGTTYSYNLSSAGTSSLTVATVAGTLGVTGETTLGNTTINGTFTLNGTTQYIVAENAVYTDNLLEIHAPSGGVGTAWTTNDGKDIGIRMHYYNGTADKNAALFMDNGDWTLKWVVDGTETNGQFTHSGFGDIQANKFIGALQGTADYVTNGVVTTGSYANPSWISSLAYSKLTGTPTIYTSAYIGTTNIAFNRSSASQTLTGVSIDGTAATATNANNINISTTNGNSSDSTMYPVLVSSSSTGNQLPHTDTSGLSYNASSNTLTASTFNGDLSGNADTATDVAGGSTNQILYQSSSNNTSFITAPTNNTHLTYTTGGGFAWAATTDAGNLSSITVSGTASFNGLTQVQQLHIPYIAKSNASSTVTHDCSAGQIFYHTSPSANFTANFTNLNLANGYTTEIKLIIVQGNTPRIPNAVQIAGSTKTIGWLGNSTPSGTANRTEIVTFKVLLNGTNYSVFGKLESYGNSSNAGGGGGGG